MIHCSFPSRKSSQFHFNSNSNSVSGQQRFTARKDRLTFEDEMRERESVWESDVMTSQVTDWPETVLCRANFQIKFGIHFISLAWLSLRMWAFFFFFFFKLPAIYPLDSLPILYGQNECPLPTACTRYYLYIYKLERIPISFQSWIKDNDNGMTMVSSHEKVLYMNGEI